MGSAATVAFAAVAGKALDMAGGYDAGDAVGAGQDRSYRRRDGPSHGVNRARWAGLRFTRLRRRQRGQAFLAQAGFDVNEILSALPATLALATAGELGLADACRLIASNVVSGLQA